MPKNRQRKRQGRGRPQRRRASVPRNPLGGIRDMYRFQRSVNVQTIQWVNSVGYLGALSLTRGTLTSALISFVQTFDLFRINRIRVRWMPEWNVNVTSAVGADGVMPQFAAVVNYDDFNTPTSFDQLLGTGGARLRRMTGPQAITCYPMPLAPVLVTAGTAPNVIMLPHNTWMNTSVFNSSFTPNFPLCKFGINAAGARAASGFVDIYFDLDFTLAQHLSG